MFLSVNAGRSGWECGCLFCKAQVVSVCRVQLDHDVAVIASRYFRKDVFTTIPSDVRLLYGCSVPFLGFFDLLMVMTNAMISMS